MIPSAKSRWFTAWFTRQAHARLRATFGAIRLAGRDRLERALASGPVLVISNHTAWWDPLLALVLAQRVVSGADGYAMMDAANLRRLPFFAKVGAFGVDRDSRHDGAEATRHAVALLDRPGRLVWIFPQGQERPLHERPLRFLGGAAAVARRVSAATVLPVGLAYAFGAEAAPSAFVAVGDPVRTRGAAAADRQAQVEAVEQQLARIEREQSRPGSEAFEVIELQRPGWLGRLAERALAALTRPFVPGLAPALDQPKVSATRSTLPANIDGS